MTNLDLDSAYVGNSQVSKIYLGNEEVWPAADPYLSMPLTFEITSPGNILWKTTNASYPKTIQYKINDGVWTNITSTTLGATISVNSGDIVQLRGDNSSYGASNYYHTFGTTCNFIPKGNIMSLIDSTGFTTATTLQEDYTFYHMFWGCGGLGDATNLKLPATALTTSCYEGMFAICTGMTTTPALPATHLALSCYAFMFASCSFSIPPALPATGLATRCYFSMFSGNYNLLETPELPATVLENYCYQGMFNVCPNLSKASVLPAAVLRPGSYAEMFKSCSSLKQITCLATDMTASTSLGNWLYGVSSTGTFYKHPNATWPSGDSGIPSGWTVVDYVDPNN